MLVLLFSVITLAFFGSSVEGFRLQGVAVKGRLLCGGRPLSEAKVAIYDVDRSELLMSQTTYMCGCSDPGDADDLLDAATTTSSGQFHVDGTTRELTNIEPELRVLHDCNDDIRVSDFVGGG